MNDTIFKKDTPVTPLAGVSRGSVTRLLASLGMILEQVGDHQEIPGSFWGESEAGLIGNRLYARSDTPLHSILHESCHYVCMDDERKANLHTDAGGDYAEEDAVCYLQILLADQIQGYSREQCQRDMDSWGYTFRLGSAKAWFDHDAHEAHRWLESRDLLPEPFTDLSGDNVIQTTEESPFKLKTAGNLIQFTPNDCKSS